MLQLQSVYFGQIHKDFDYKDFNIVKKVARLARKHEAQCINDCNGAGYINGQKYYTGTIDDWARRQYGANVKDGCIDDKEHGEITVFYLEIKKIEDKINKILFQFNHDKYALWPFKPLRVEFQHDPRGNTVKLFYEDEYINIF